MQIRTKLTLQFLLIGGAIMFIASCAIYFSSANFRRDDFYRQLENKANNTANLLIDVDEIDINLLKRIEKDNPANLPNEKIIILNFRNDTLYSSDDKGEISIGKDILNKIRLNECLTYRQGKHEVIGYLYTGRFDRFAVIAAATDINGFSKLRNLRIILTVVCLTSLLLFAIAGWFYSGRALEPISGVVSQVEEITIQSLNLRVDEGNGTDELARLARTFNKMLDRLEEAFKMQKDFISNASHEIRTPLTSIYGQLQVLQMKVRSVEEYKSAISSVIEDIRNLSGLTNNLLLLAQTRSENAQKNNSGVRIDEILWQSKEELLKTKTNYRIDIGIDQDYSDSEADHLSVTGNEYLLKVACSNLMDNACKFSENHSCSVRITKSVNGISIVFADQGIGIPEEDKEKIFEPFHRADNAKSTEGHGIGLSIVRRIILNSKGTISLTSEAGKGTTVVVGLPSAF